MGSVNEDSPRLRFGLTKPSNTRMRNVKTLNPGRTLAPEPSWLWSGEIPSLNGFRAIAITAVLLAHFVTTSSDPWVQEALNRTRTRSPILISAQVGVDLF